MTINTINNTSGPYVGNGLSDTFDYDFKIFEESQLVIYETDDLGNVTTLQLGTDYSVNILSDAGGTVTRLAGPLPTGYTWYIKSNYQPTQDISFTSQGAFFPQIHEDAFDKFAMITQQLSENLARSLRVPESETNIGDLVVPDAQTRAGRVLAFDEQGKPVEFSTMNQMNDVIGGMSAIETVSDNIAAVLDAHQNAIDAATSAANAAASEVNAAASEVNAAASEVNAAASEVNAAASETNAATSAANAATSAANAAASEVNAAMSETNAATSEANALDRANYAADRANYAENRANYAEEKAIAAESAATAAYEIEQGIYANQDPTGYVAELINRKAIIFATAEISNMNRYLKQKLTLMDKYLI